MNWSFIPMPSAEELASGYVPSPASHSEDESAIRRFLVTLFVIIGLVTGLQLAVSDPHENGQRRLAETNIGERKGPCRECAQIILSLSSPEGASHVPPPATPIL